MKRITLLFILLAFGINGFSQKATKADSMQIRTTITAFYTWYNKNWQKMSNFRLYTGTRSIDNPPYKINWKEAEKYFGYIRTSVPQLGEAFISNERIFLKECDSAFKADPSEEMPYGFDYDRFTNSQEDPQWLLDELKKSRLWEITSVNNTANVDVLGSFLEQGKEVETVVMCFEMKKEKARLNDKVGQGKWKIAKIGCKFIVPGVKNDQ